MLLHSKEHLELIIFRPNVGAQVILSRSICNIQHQFGKQASDVCQKYQAKQFDHQYIVISTLHKGNHSIYPKGTRKAVDR